MYGMMRTDNTNTDRYYVVQQTSEPYTVQKDKEMKGYTQPVTTYAGDNVCDVIFLNPVPNAKY